MLQRISQEDSVDVFGFVRQMRYQRNFMVQTEVCEIDDESPKNVKILHQRPLWKTPFFNWKHRVSRTNTWHTKLSSEHLDKFQKFGSLNLNIYKRE